MNSLRARLIVSFLLVIAISMLTATGITWLAVEDLYVTTQRENLQAQAERVAKTLPRDTPAMRMDASAAQSQNALPGIATRVLDADGSLLLDGPALVAESPLTRASGYTPPAGPESFAARGEIQRALRGQAATEIRVSPVDASRRVIFAAAPVPSTDSIVHQIVYLSTPLPQTGTLISALRTQLIGAGLVALLLAGIAGIWLSARLARPIRALAAAASQASANAALPQAVPVQARIDEIDALAGAFNRMTETLRQSDHARTAFVADVSHELRTPLTVIKGAVETIQDNPDDENARARFWRNFARDRTADPAGQRAADFDARRRGRLAAAARACGYARIHTGPR